MKKTVLLAALGIVACASVASAANREGQFSLSPVIGGYSYDSGQHIDTSLIYGARAGYNITKHVGIEALFDYVNTEPTRGKKDIDMYRYGGELLYHFFPDNKFVPYVAAGFAGLNFDAQGIERRTRGAFDYGVGAKYFLNDNIAIRGDVRHIMYKINNTFGNYINNNVEYTVGAYIPFGGAKPAVQPVAAPPEPVKVVEPAPAPAVVAAPAPTANLTVVPASIVKGETATLNWKSKNASKCEIQPEIGPVPPNGARVITPSVSTGYTLTCTGEGVKATSDASVTVTAPAVAQAVQQKATPAAERFCNKPAVLNIHFDTDKSDIKPKYEGELKTVGAFLKEFPKAKGEISGHTDSVASEAYNQKLSERRATSVAKYIISHFGIEAGRITTKGYGETKPVADNKTKEGRAKNRRIEANFTCE